MKNYLKNLSERLFNQLESHEELALGLHSENSDFVRFSQSRVRQNTQVQQHELNLKYQAQHRTYNCSLNLTLNLETDTSALNEKLQWLRQNLKLIDENPQYTALENNGVSEVYKKSTYPVASEFIGKVSGHFADADLAGLYCTGPIRQASLNSKGQFHYFENDHFFFDYSIYDGPRAVKGYYSDTAWNEQVFTQQAQQNKNTLSLLKRPQVKVKPGQHRTYLAPMAVAEAMEIFNWNAVSHGAFERGFTPLKKLKMAEQLMSPLFTLAENNDLGLHSHFNGDGEICPRYLPIIEEGRLKNLMISKTTAKEYDLTSNQANSRESMRSFEVRAGTLSETEMLQQLNTGLFLGNLHYINWSDPQAARLTGMTRFACFWVENGEIVGPIQDLRFDDTLYRMFGSELLALSNQQSTFISTSTYQKRQLGGMKVPGALLKEMNFTL